MGNAKSYKCAEGDAMRSGTLLNLGSAMALLSMGRDELLLLQGALGFGEEWGVICIPTNWMPPGQKRTPSARILVLHKAIPEGWASSEQRTQDAMVALLQFALTRYLTPAGRKLFYPALGTWQQAVSAAIRVAKAALTRHQGDIRQLWSLLTVGDVLTVLPGRAAKLWTRHLQWLHARGLVADCVRSESLPQGLRDEIPRKGQSKPQNKIKTSKHWQPLPDNFVAEAGWRVVWIVKELGPVLLNIAEAISEPVEQDPRYSIETNKNIRRDRQRAILDNWRWTTSDGREFKDLPFKLHMQSMGCQHQANQTWPELTLQTLSPGDISQLLTVLQAAHIFVLFLSSGPRSSEQMSLAVGSLTEHPDANRIEGRTYKLSFQNDGEARDWPCPGVAALAIKNQERLAGLLKRKESPHEHDLGDHLWVCTGAGAKKRGSELRNFNDQLGRLVNVLGLGHLLGQSKLHTHRFRKTIARLIALALIGAPKILMDLFGHTDIEMTISYILSNPDIRAEVELVARAQLIILAKEAASNAEGNGGPAAKTVREVVRATRARLSKDVLDSDDLEEVAEALTLGGTSWQLVRPGVVCTKTELESGPCTRRIGRPEPSRCRTNCINRLELESERENVDAVLEESVARRCRALAEDDPVSASLWAGQILAHLDRFPDLRQKWIQHPAVANLVATPSTENSDHG